MNKPSIYYRIALTVTLCFCLALGASAQQLFTIKGVVFKKNTPETIAGVAINNVTRKTTATGDEVGGFHIQAAIGDTLLFTKTDYSPQTIVLQSYNLTIYLQHNILLNEVTIKDVSKNQELNNTMDEYKRTGQYYTLNPSVMSVVSSPISGLYELFGKAPAEARRFQQYSREEQERITVHKRYNKELIQKTVKIPDNEIEAFMLAFTPSYEDIQAWTDYDIIKYIQKSYEYFELNKDKLKVDKLY